MVAVVVVLWWRGGGDAAILRHYTITVNLKEIVTQTKCGRRQALEASNGREDM